MYRYLLSLVAFLSLLSSLSLGQGLEERLKKASAIAKEHPKDDFIVTNHLTEIKFDLEENYDLTKFKDDGPITASVDEKMLFYNLKDFRVHYESIYHTGESKITDLKRYDIQDGKLKKEYVEVKSYDYQMDNMFHHDVKVKSFKLSYGLAGQEMGYGYKESYKDVKYLTNVYFHDSYFCKNREISVEVPNWLNLEVKEFNFDGFNIQKVVEDKGDYKKIRYIVEGMQGWPKESDRVGSAHTFPHLVFVVKDYLYKDTRYRTFTDVGDLYAWYGTLVKSCENKPDQMKDLVTQLTEGKSKMEQVKSIYYWVQDNIRYIAFEDGIAGFKPEDAYKVYDNKYGDCKGMANLLKSMLVLAGFDARLTWIGTHSKPYDYSFPSLLIDNHMICTLYLDGKEYFLDGTESYQRLGDNAYRLRGKQVLIEDGVKYKLSRVPKGVSDDRDSIYYKLRLEGDQLKGKAEMHLSGSDRVSFMNYFLGINSSDREDLVKSWFNRRNKNLQIDAFEVKNALDRDRDIAISYELHVDNMVAKVGATSHVGYQLLDDYTYYKKEEGRLSAYDFHQALNQVRVFEIELPSGAQVEFLPTELKINNVDFWVNCSAVKRGNKVIVTRKIMVPKGYIAAEHLDAWSEANEKIDAFMNNQIIVRR